MSKQRFGKFEVIRLLGHGAMGEVFLAQDPAIDREVAIKVIRSTSANAKEARTRFEREAKAAGKLNHQNIVTVHDFGEDAGDFFIVMEYVKGNDLEELLRDQTLTHSELLEVLAQVCDGLGHAHRNGIIHRDVKPSNIRVIREEGHLLAKVMDFGVARLNDSSLTATSMFMGTASYMAPEYIESGKPDVRTDIFAVGVMLYESLSGSKPFSGDTLPTILMHIINDPPLPIDTRSLNGISPSVSIIMERALQKNPGDRFQTTEEMASALRIAKDPAWTGDLPETGKGVSGAYSNKMAESGTPHKSAKKVPDTTPTPATFGTNDFQGLLRRARIGTKIMMSFAAVASIAIFVGILALIDIRLMHEANKVLYSDATKGLDYTGQMVSAFGGVRLAIRDATLERDATNRQKINDEYNEHRKGLIEAERELREIAKSEKSPVVREIKTGLIADVSNKMNDFLKNADEMMDLVMQGKSEKAIANLREYQAINSREQFGAAIEVMKNVMRDVAKAQVETTTDISDRAAYIMTLTVLFSIGISVLLGAYIAKALRRIHRV